MNKKMLGFAVVSVLNLCSGTAHATSPVIPNRVAHGTVLIKEAKNPKNSLMHINGDAAHVLFSALDRIVNPEGVIEPAVYPAQARSVSNEFARCDRIKVSVTVERPPAVCDPKNGDCVLDNIAPLGKNSYSCRINIGHALGAN